MLDLCMRILAEVVLQMFGGPIFEDRSKSLLFGKDLNLG